jgi:hypothetical protein
MLEERQIDVAWIMDAMLLRRESVPIRATGVRRDHISPFPPPVAVLCIATAMAIVLL